MGLWEERVVPHLVNFCCGMKAFVPLRRDTTAGLSGDVVEVGFGSGLNVGLYPPEVTRILAVEPSTRGRDLGADRIAGSAIPIEFIGLEGERIPLADEAVPSALSTFTLCTIPDAPRAIAEIARVLRPGGRFHFIEHGRSPDPKVARTQDRLTPVQRRLFGGCHLNRRIDELVSGSGLSIERLDNFYVQGPRFAGYMYEGVAIKQ